MIYIGLDYDPKRNDIGPIAGLSNYPTHEIQRLDLAGKQYTGDMA
jgi:hypothetical protein